MGLVDAADIENFKLTNSNNKKKKYNCIYR